MIAVASASSSPSSQINTPQVPDASSEVTDTAQNATVTTEDGSITHSQTEQVEATVTDVPSDHQEHIVIPSIELDDVVINVGLNDKGEMAVPDGSTNNVGWWKDGTVPGQDGSAVMDAHVFAAFKRLHELAAGDDIYIINENAQKLHFVVDETKYYALADMPLEYIFHRAGGSHLDLITCAGTFQRSMGTYDHRLVVYSTLVND